MPDKMNTLRSKIIVCDQVILYYIAASRASLIKRTRKDYKSFTDPYQKLGTYYSEGGKIFVSNKFGFEATAIGDGEYIKEAGMFVDITNACVSPIRRTKKDYKTLTGPYNNVNPYHNEGGKVFFLVDDPGSDTTAIGGEEYTKDAAMFIDITKTRVSPIKRARRLTEPPRTHTKTWTPTTTKNKGETIFILDDSGSEATVI